MNWQSNWDKPVDVLKATQSPQINPTSSPFPEWDNKSRDEVLLEWQQRQQLLAVAKEREMEFRKYVVSRAFPNPNEGMNTLDLGNGYALKAQVKYTYNLDPDNSKVEAALDKLAAIDNQGPFLADRLVAWKPTLSLKEYRELEPKYKKVIDEVLIINEAAPSLELKEPKVKK